MIISCLLGLLGYIVKLILHFKQETCAAWVTCPGEASFGAYGCLEIRNYVFFSY